MSAVLVNESEILTYIPQRKPIVMVSEIVSCNTKGIETRLNISDDNIFVVDGLLQEAGVIENIAQSAAAMTGYHAKQNSEEVKRGFIGSVKNLTLSALPEANASIVTQINIVTEVMNATVIEGIVKQKDEILARCQMNIFLEE